MSGSKKQSFLHGAALLTLATIVVKVIGAFYKIPLKMVIGDMGYGYFMSAYDIYTVLLMISTAGLPVALSRMISEASSLGRYGQLRRTYLTAQGIFLGLGVAGSLLMTLFARELAQWLNSPNSWVAIACLGPSALLICLMSAFRGFFQGQSDMIPTSVSQVLEAVCKLVIGLLAAWVIYRNSGSVPMAAGGAILGVTIGCVFSTVFLGAKFFPAWNALPRDQGTVDSYGETAKKLLAIAVPITIGSTGLQLINMLSIKVYMGGLLNIGNTQDQADTLKGIYNMSQTIFNLPCSFVVPLTVSSLPVITSLLTQKRLSEVKATEESAFRITALIAAPCSAGLMVLGKPVMGLLGGYSGEYLVLGGWLLSIIGLCVVIHALVMLTNSMLQAHGNATAPAVHMFIGGVVKLWSIYVLCNNPDVGIVGVPIATILCYAVILVLNLFAVKKSVEDAPKLLRNIWRSLVSAGVMGAVVFAVMKVLEGVFGYDSGMGKLLLCALPVCVGVVVYVVLAVKLKSITRADCELLPKGKKIADILHL